MKLQQISQNLKTAAAGVTLTLTLAGFGIIETAQAQPSQSTQSTRLSDGMFLYGQTPQPNKLRHEYVVFSHQDGAVVGAIYYPRSEFVCFTGSLENKTIDIKSVDTSNAKNAEAKIELSDLQQVSNISSTDQRILSMCKKATIAFAN
jgi:hypothetical protein